MDQQNKETSEIFMETVSLKIAQQDQKLEAQSKKLIALENRLKEPPEWFSTVTDIKRDVQALQADINKKQLSAEKAQELSDRLNSGLARVNQPVKSEVIHRHHVNASLWVAIGMFLIFCLVSSGWYMTAEKARDFRANDFKYRQLKLVVDSTGSAYLYRLDSLYRDNIDSFENGVLEQERLKEERFELEDRLGNVKRKIDNWKAGDNLDKSKK